MDGVLADFVGGCLRAHGRPSPYTDPVNLGIFEIEKIWGMSAEEFWKPCDGPRFWDDLDKTPEADKIVQLVTRRLGTNNVAILTSPSMSPYCVPGKRRWMRRYFPQLAENMIFTSAKKFLAHPNAVLIDDRDDNIWDFLEFGGRAVTVPRPWNKLHGFNVVTHVRNYVQDL